MFRDPWDRFCSAFFNVKEKHLHPAHRIVKDLTMTQFLEVDHPHIFVSNQRDNYYIRELTGQISITEPMTEADCDQAIINLETYFADIGMLSSIEKFWKHLAAKYNWTAHIDPGDHWRNKTKKKERVTVEDHVRFQELNMLDYRVFERAKQLCVS